MFPSFGLVVTLVIYSTHALVQKDGVGKLPALGWNSWNAFRCDVNEDKIMIAANEMVNLGLKDAGYEYVNIDDCWSVKAGRDASTNRLIPDPNTFPSGIKSLAEQIHALGLKIGIYSDDGTTTCGGYPASLGYELIDAETFAAWNIDYLKYDDCNVPPEWIDQYESCVPEPRDSYLGPFPNGTCPPKYFSRPPSPTSYDWSRSNTTQRYNTMRDALLEQNRTILFSLCNGGQAEARTWANGTGNSWRISGDITANWPRIVEILNQNSFQLDSVDFWGHNDADMLEVGNGNLTLEENRSHFAFWAAMKSPLIIGTALDELSNELVNVLKNRYLLAFNQDEVFGKPAMPYKWGANPDWTWNSTSPAEYWSGASENGILVLAFNPLGVEMYKEIFWSEVPELRSGGGAFEVVDIWTGEDLGCVTVGINRTVPTHDTVGFMVGKQCSAITAPTSSSALAGQQDLGVQRIIFLL
ncbi:glycoside hydrolase family 27 protein [Stipitochalara longipes BDJ]|nr:glycoside hydrolase family 27 protein [Stipitochalara longipes BDJ]